MVDVKTPTKTEEAVPSRQTRLARLTVPAETKTKARSSPVSAPSPLPPLGKYPLGLFLTRALQDEWEKVSFLLPPQKEGEKPKIKTFDRQTCEEELRRILKEENKLLGTQKAKTIDLASPENLSQWREHLLEQLKQQVDYPAKSSGSQALIDQYIQRVEFLSSTPDRPINLPSLATLRGAVAHNEEVQRRIGVEEIIKPAVDARLEKYPSAYRARIGQALSEQVQKQVMGQVLRGQEIDIDQALRVTYRIPNFQAAVADKSGLGKELKEKLAQVNAQRDNILANYNALRKVQVEMGLPASYEQMLFRFVGSGLSPAEANIVLTGLERRLPPQATSFEFQYYLREALSPYQDKLKSLDNLALEFAPSFENYIHFGDRSRWPHFVSPEAEKLAGKLKIKDPRVAQAFILGYSAKDLQSRGFAKLADQLGDLEEKLSPDKVFKRKSPEVEALKERKKSLKAWKKVQKKEEKVQKKEEWLKRMQTSNLGWVRTPRMRVGMAWRQSAAGKAWAAWGNKVDNFKKTSPVGWVLAPKMRASMALRKSFLGKAFQAWGNKVEDFKQKHALGFLLAPRRRLYGAIGNWLHDKLKHQAAEALIGGGLKGLAKHALGKALVKIGLGSLIGGPVGTAIGVATTALTLAYTILKNKQMRELLLQAGATLAYLLWYLFSKFPLTIVGAGVGFAVGGPIGAIIGGGAGFLLDKAIGGLGGIIQGAGSLLAPTAVFLEQAVGIPVTASLSSVATLSMVTVFGSILGPFVVALFVITTIISAFFAPPEEEKKVESFLIPSPTGEYRQEVSQITNLLSSQDCGGGIINKNTWPKVEGCLLKAGYRKEEIAKLQDSLWVLGETRYPHPEGEIASQSAESQP